MAKIKIHAGDFPDGDASLLLGSIRFPMSFLHGIAPESVSVSELEEIDIASEESVARIGGKIGWGAAGGILLGPVGLLAGLLLGGRKKEITFVAKFKDGRKFLATTEADVYKKLMTATFKK